MRRINQQQVLAVKLDLRGKQGDETYRRLRDLGWQAARYRNNFIRHRWAEALKWKLPEESEHDRPSKQGRKDWKQELSGAAYSACEREVQGAWTRSAKQILAGRPLPEWKPEAALSIRGHKRKADSGVRVEFENDRFVAYLSAQNKDCEGGCWLRCPIAKHTKRDERQGDILRSMVAWDVPIAKATIQINVRRRRVILRLTYAIDIEIEEPGERTAILGPVEYDSHGRIHRLLLRTDFQTKDYTSRLLNLLRRKDEWDGIRRRALRQIGRRRGHARDKRERLAQLSWQDWLTTYLHTWSADVAQWLPSQHVGILHVVEIETGDWPADRFTALVKYKCEERGIEVDEDASVLEKPAERAAKGLINKSQRKVKKRREAVRELMHQMS